MTADPADLLSFFSIAYSIYKNQMKYDKKAGRNAGVREKGTVFCLFTLIKDKAV